MNSADGAQRELSNERRKLLGVAIANEDSVRDHLIAMDLIAFDGRRFQVLSLPPTPIMPRPLVTFAAIRGDRLRCDQHCLGVLTASPPR